MSERREGWYWTQWDSEGEWECSEWRGDHWDDNEPSCEPVVVGDRIPTPGEMWQCVPKLPTEEMRRAATAKVGPFISHACWDAMLQAAPSPGQEE